MATSSAGHMARSVGPTGICFARISKAVGELALGIGHPTVQLKNIYILGGGDVLGARARARGKIPHVWSPATPVEKE